MRFKILALISILLLVSQVSAVYVGIVDGYVRDVDGNLVVDARVTAHIDGCSGNGCSNTGRSDSEGYYVIGNLNVPKNGKVSVKAVKGTSSGTGTGSSDEYHIAHVDVVICDAPSDPVLDLIGETHSNSVIFSWDSGIDPNGRGTYDEFKLNDGDLIGIGSGVNRELAFSDHTWKVRTCNNFCCGDFGEETFRVYNNPPSKPTPSTKVNAGLVTMDWESGVDPDDDPTYDEFRLKGGEAEEKTPPVIKSGEGLIQWQVRTCDVYNSCSDWSGEDAFSCEKISETCPTLEEIRGAESLLENYCGGGGVDFWCAGKRVENVKKVEMKDGEINLYFENQTLKNLEYCPWCYNQKQDYDEQGVDCGGDGCPDCGVPKRIIQKCRVPSWMFIFLLLSLIALGVIVWVKKSHPNSQVVDYSRRFGYVISFISFAFAIYFMFNVTKCQIEYLFFSLIYIILILLFSYPKIKELWISYVSKISNPDLE